MAREGLERWKAFARLCTTALLPPRHTLASCAHTLSLLKGCDIHSRDIDARCRSDGGERRGWGNDGRRAGSREGTGRGRQGRVDGAAGLEGVSVLLRGCSVMAAERLALLRCSCVHLCVLVCAGVCWLPAGVCVCVCVCE